MTVAPEDLPKALHELASAEHLSEAVLLSTCNRIEVYAYAERFHGGYADVREMLARHSGLPPETVSDELYAQHDADAVRHLFSVAAGLDSVVVGEHEVLGQVRDAWQAARAEGTVGTVLEPLFRRAVETGKRARSSTGIARGIASLSHAAVALAEARLEGLAGRRVLVIGAGDVAAGTLKSLADAGVADIAVANRTPERAEAAATALRRPGGGLGRAGVRSGGRRRGDHHHRGHRHSSGAQRHRRRDGPAQRHRAADRRCGRPPRRRPKPPGSCPE